MKAMSSINFQVNNPIIMASSFYLLLTLSSAKTQFKSQTPKTRCLRDPLAGKKTTIQLRYTASTMEAHWLEHRAFLREWQKFFFI